MTEHTCPVCGFEMEDYPADYNICPCCSTEFGYNDAGPDRPGRLRELRELWVAGGMQWWAAVFEPAPVGWDPVKQLARLTADVEVGADNDTEGGLNEP